MFNKSQHNEVGLNTMSRDYSRNTCEDVYVNMLQSVCRIFILQQYRNGTATFSLEFSFKTVVTYVSSSISNRVSKLGKLFRFILGG